MKSTSAVRDSYLLGQSKFERWRASFEERFFGGELITLLARVWNTMSMDERMQIKASNPEAFETMERKFGGK